MGPSQGEQQMADEVRYGFGDNWERFVREGLTEEIVRSSRECLLKFLGLTDLKGKVFLDVGCGSGLSSLAAFDAGAARVISFDYDPASVNATKKLRGLRDNPANWTVTRGSVLDPDFLAGFEKADIVYAWGVLHHTGHMWNAVRNAATLMKEDGVFFLALYTTDRFTPFWTRTKLRYNRAGPLRRKLMEWLYVLLLMIIPNLLLLRNPFKRMRDYRKSRGMSFMVDVRDWLGGYPFETARPEEVLFFARNELALEVVNLATGQACAEYLLAAPDKCAEWARRHT
jgi:2-polyprenyl-3-methyl-5-hydroxy-6-metoxy-1,4-benzoquinol methylase